MIETRQLGADETIQGKDVSSERDGILKRVRREDINFGWKLTHSDIAPRKCPAWIVENTGSPYGEAIPL
jgi:hypothetical protein